MVVKGVEPKPSIVVALAVREQNDPGEASSELAHGCWS
jgi:hypothetical protein